MADALVVCAIHEAAQGREPAAHEEFEVAKLAGGQIPGGPFLGMSLQFGSALFGNLQLDKFAPVGRNKMTGQGSIQ